MMCRTIELKSLPEKNKSRSNVPCVLWHHQFRVLIPATVDSMCLMCDICGWSLVEILNDIDMGGKCSIGNCKENRKAGTAVCGEHGAVNTFK